MVLPQPSPSPEAVLVDGEGRRALVLSIAVTLDQHGRLGLTNAARPEERMSLAMTRKEREAFLADAHVGIIAISQEGRGPLAVPVWYAYDPGGEVRLVTGRTSRKGQLLERARRFSLCAQTETPPYKYVSVDGPVIAIDAADLERDLRPLAHRYLGSRNGDAYIEQVRGEPGYADNVVVRMRPEQWLTADFAKAQGAR